MTEVFPPSPTGYAPTGGGTPTAPSPSAPETARLDVEPGFELPPLSTRITRKDLVRYAGASLDFNPIHWNEQVAVDAGLPGVIAHGMLTMALAGRLVSEWTGDAGRIVDLSARFTRPVIVPNDDDGAQVDLTGKVTAADDGLATITITAKFDGRPILGKATAVVRLT